MKIALLIQRFPGGGAEKYVEEIATRLHKKGEDVTVITSENKESDDSNYDFKIVRLSSIIKIGEYSVWRGLDKILKHEKFDIVHSNTYGYYHSDKVARLKKKLGYKLVMTSHGFTGMDLHKLKKEKIIKNTSPFDFLREIYDEKIGKKTLLLCDHLIALSQYDYDFYKKINVDESKISIIPIGISNKYFTIDSILETKLKKSIIADCILLSVGELSWNKNHQLAIRALPKILEFIPNTKYLVIGNDGGELENLSSLVKSLYVENHVLFLGYKKPEEISSYMRISDIFLHTSYAEGLSTVLLEAITCNLPFVTTPVGGNTNIASSFGGVLIDHNDEYILANSVIKLFKQKSLRINSSNTISNFSWDDIFTKIYKLYCKLVI